MDVEPRQGLETAIRSASQYLLDRQNPEGYWLGELEADTTLESDYILLQLWLYPPGADGRWTPGQFIEGRVTIGEMPVALAVPLSALQRFREFDVVFAQVGETYEVRMLTLGRRDTQGVEVLGGLDPGTVFVSENSYLIKADIEKAGASHDH